MNNNASLLSYLQGIGVPTEIIQALTMGSGSQPMQLPVNQQMPMGGMGMNSQTPAYAGPTTGSLKIGGGSGGSSIGSGGGGGGMGGLSSILGMF